MTQELSSPETAVVVLAHIEKHPSASLRSVARDLGIGRTTAQRAVRRLIAEGRLEVVRRGTGDRYPTTYRPVVN